MRYYLNIVNRKTRALGIAGKRGFYVVRRADGVLTPLGGDSREAGGESFGWKALSLRLRLRADAFLCEGGF